MARQVPLDAPYRAARADEWDGQTFESWKLANARDPDTRRLLDLAAEAVFGAQPRDLSLLFFLFYAHSAGSVEQLVDTAGGAQELLFEGGTQLICDELAKRIGRRRILLGGRVQSITQRRGGVELLTRRHRVRAKRTIVAIPPTLAARIDYKPRLPALRDQLTQRFPMGSVIKTFAVYDTPFWREDGLTGQATSDTGPAKITFDASPQAGRPGVLLGFVEGQEARDLTPKPPAERAARVLESYQRYFGPRARNPAQYFDRPWSTDVFARGCYVGILPPGALTGFGSAIREPFDRIHWAGTETATRWMGYMDGAVQSGERAAREVLAEL
jgi:monoamine oxidase